MAVLNALIWKHVDVSDGKWIGADYESTESQRYVGMRRSDVLALTRDIGIPLRVVEDGKKNVLTADLNRQRLTVLLVGETVTEAAFF
jgi:hypothetical protein